MTIRTGDIRRGVSMANNSGDVTLCKECASILSMRQLPDAARLYERGEAMEKAAAVYIQCKDTVCRSADEKSEVGEIARSICEGKEAVKDFKAAITAYEAAKNMDAVVRIYLII